MKLLFSQFKYLIISLFVLNFVIVKAENHIPVKSYNQNSELLIESNKQKSDLKNSIFYAEGNVIITNTNKEFIAKSKKAIFYKLLGKIKLVGDVEITTSDFNKIKAGEIFYYPKDNKFEAVSDQNQRVNSKFVFYENNILTESSN